MSRWISAKEEQNLLELVQSKDLVEKRTTTVKGVGTAEVVYSIRRNVHYLA
jgi:hypothetical protein